MKQPPGCAVGTEGACRALGSDLKHHHRAIRTGQHGALPTLRKSGTAVWVPGMSAALEGAVQSVTEGYSWSNSSGSLLADLPALPKSTAGFCSTLSEAM